MRQDDRRTEAEATGDRRHADNRQILEGLRDGPCGEASVQPPGDECEYRGRSDEHPAERGDRVTVSEARGAGNERGARDDAQCELEEM